MADKDKDNVAKDVLTATSYQEQLQLSLAESGVIVVDVYNTQWGYCRSIAPTFRRLMLEAPDGTKLRFVSADSLSILNDIKSNSAFLATAHVATNVKHGKNAANVAAATDIFPEAWIPIFETQKGRAKPLFLFYKSGKLAKKIKGCKTPEIVQIIKDLTKVQISADEYITNPQLLDMWATYFNISDSEIPWTQFMQTLNILCKLTVPLNDMELNAVKDAIGVKNDRSQIVHAEKLQGWVQEGSVMQAFTALLPNYEERAIHDRVEREKAEKKIQLQKDAEKLMDQMKETETEENVEEENIDDVNVDDQDESGSAQQLPNDESEEQQQAADE